MKNNFFLIILISLAIVCFTSFFAVKIVAMPLNPSDVSKRTLMVPSGTSVRSAGEKLYSEGFVRSSDVFYLSARYPFVKKILTGESEPFVLKSGVYKLSPSMNLKEILDVLSSGEQEYIRVTVPEGLTLSKIGMIMESACVCSHEDFMSAARNRVLLDEYDIPASSFEGFLFPDTYFFTPAMEADVVIETMVKNFFEKFKTIKNAGSLSCSELMEKVILASIIEREYRIASEAPLISSVFNNRLKRNIGLYSCATLEYIITEIEGLPHPDVITYKDTQVDSPYNTYKWAGLPPGPISNPGLVALDAAVNPSVSDYYFFRLVDPEKGNHVFSKSFSSHVENGHSYNTKKSGY
ncbi:MAG: endolytic transglycosylase MltG [Treponema sp.]|nr:endolytic transglycosylase MltG [Treponema sp.]